MRSKVDGNKKVIWSLSPLPIASASELEWLILERKHQEQQQQQQQQLLRVENYRKRKIIWNIKDKNIERLKAETTTNIALGTISFSPNCDAKHS